MNIFKLDLLTVVTLIVVVGVIVTMSIGAANGEEKSLKNADQLKAAINYASPYSASMMTNSEDDTLSIAASQP